MGLVLRLVETRTDCKTRSVDVLEISRPGDIRNIANLGLTLPEAKQLLARVQHEVVALQARDHAALRPDCAAGLRELRREVPHQGLAVPPDRDAVRRGCGAAAPVPLPGLWSSRDGG